MEYAKTIKEYVLSGESRRVLTEDLPLQWSCFWQEDPRQIDIEDINNRTELLRFSLHNSDPLIHMRTAVTHIKLFSWSRYTKSWIPFPPFMWSYTFVNCNSENLISINSHNLTRLKLVVEVNIPKESSIFYDLSKENDQNNGSLVVGAEKFYIKKEILSAFSPVFDNLFNNHHFEESKRDEIELKEIDSHEFWTLLQVIFPSNVSVNGNNVEFLWKLADRFDLISVAKVCESVLCNMEGEETGKISIENRMRIAELYDSKKLKHVLDQQMGNMNI